MSSISDLLRDAYQTGKTATSHSEEDREKLAQTELFVGLCKQNGIDIAHLTNEQLDGLWKAAMSETASATNTAPDNAEEEKAAAARREWEEKRAAAEKIAEMDALGRVMAHAYMDELRKIAEEGQKEDGKKGAPPWLKKKEEGKAEGEGDEKKASQARAEALAARLSKAAASTASKTANLDEVAGNHAIDLLKAAGVDADVALARINAVYTLGIAESEKIAAADSFERAVETRALEFCEAAGFPVNWSAA